MSWWDRYKAWQPESWWDRYKAWQLESRARYVATTVGLRALIVLLYVWLFTGSSAGRVSLVTAIFVALGILVYGWLSYPRAKAKSKQAVDWEGASSVVQNDRIDEDDQLDGMQRFYQQR